MGLAKITVRRPFELQLTAVGEPKKFTCPIISGAVVPTDYVVDDEVLDHWFVKDLIADGSIDVEVVEDEGNEGNDDDTGAPVDPSKMKVADLREAILAIDPEADLTGILKEGLIEMLTGLMKPAEPKASDTPEE